MGRRIGHRRKEVETAKQHEIQPQLTAVEGVRSSFGVPLPDRQTREADQTDHDPEARSRSVPPRACASANTGVNLRSERRLHRSEPRSTRTAQKQVHQATPDGLPRTYRADGLSAIL